jgi:transposase
VYDLKQETVRFDTTTASTYQKENPDGLFQKGMSKDHRPDLAQLKIMLATLDPLGLPLVTQTVSGNRADDPLYVPAIEQVRRVLNRAYMLYVGDSKMAALETRYAIESHNDYYLMPLPKTIVSDKKLDEYLATLSESEADSELLTPIVKKNRQGKEQTIAEGFETEEKIIFEKDGEVLTWTERRLIVRSFRYAETQQSHFEKRIDQAETVLRNLTKRKQGKKVITDRAEAEAAIKKILTENRVEGFLDVSVTSHTEQRCIRAYGKKNQRVEKKTHIHIDVCRNEEAIQQAKQRMGWRVYGCTAPKDNMSLEKVVEVYRGQYLIEKDMSRLKGRPLSITPFYLQKEDHIGGLVHLLCIALSALTLFEFVIRRSLQEENETLSGIYPGNPKRQTARPSAELLLRAFRGINCVRQPGAPPWLTELTALQLKILKLMGFSGSIYERAAAIPNTC